MRKLFFAFTIIMSSFFCYFNVVKAETYNFTISEDSFSYLNNDFFLLRDYALDYIEENPTSYYHIYYNTNNSEVRLALIPSRSNKIKQFTFDSTNIYINFAENSIICKIISSQISCDSSPLLYSYTFTLNVIDGKVLYYSPLDGNYLFNWYSGSNVINLSYLNYSKLVGNINYTEYEGSNIIHPYQPLPTLYEIYSATSDYEPPNLHGGELHVLSTFYTLVIEKIISILEVISSNYIYLSMVVIVILLTVIGLIRRYLL